MSSAGSASDRPTLEEARSRLRELGYLDAPVERLLFRTVFSGRGGAFFPAVLIGAFAAALSAIAAIAAGEPGVAGSPATVAAVFLHVFAADLVPAAALAFLLSRLAERSRTPGLAATFAGFGAALVIFALWSLGTYGLARGPLGGRASLGPAGGPRRAPPRFGGPPRVHRARVRALRRAAAPGQPPGVPRGRARSGCSPRSCFSSPGARRPRSRRRSPRRGPRRWSSRRSTGSPSTGPSAPRRWSPCSARGASGWWPAERVSPPEIWTTLATGVSSRRHGVRALSRVRPLGAVRVGARAVGDGVVAAPHRAGPRARGARAGLERRPPGARILGGRRFRGTPQPVRRLVGGGSVAGRGRDRQPGGPRAPRTAERPRIAPRCRSFDRERAAGFAAGDRVSAGLRHRAGRARASRTRRRQGRRVAHAPGGAGVARRDRARRRGRRQPSRARRPGTDGRVRRSGGAADGADPSGRRGAVDPRAARRSPGGGPEGAPVASLFAARTVEETSVPSYGARVAPAGSVAPESRSRVSGEAEEPGVFEMMALRSLHG